MSIVLLVSKHTCTCNECNAEVGQEEHLEDEIASLVHNQPGHDGDNGQSKVLDCLHSIR